MYNSVEWLEVVYKITTIFRFFPEDLEDDLERLLLIIQLPRRPKERTSTVTRQSANVQLSVSIEKFNEKKG